VDETDSELCPLVSFGITDAEPSVLLSVHIYLGLLTSVFICITCTARPMRNADIAKKLLSFQVEVFWVSTPCSVAIGYHRSGWPCCLHLQGTLTPTLVSYLSCTLRVIQEDLDLNYKEAFEKSVLQME